MVNPNGPLSDAGSRKDNGQTGRKLVMDYYGPRVPLEVGRSTARIRCRGSVRGAEGQGDGGGGC